MNATFDNFYSRLNKLIHSISEINHLLKEDQSLLSQNKLQDIVTSDEKKQQLLNDMSQQAIQLRNCLPEKQHGETASSLEIYLNHLDQPQAAQAGALIRLLQDKLTEGYQYLISNNQIVTTNLGYVKEIWDRLSGLAYDKNSIYEKPSNTSK